MLGRETAIQNLTLRDDGWFELSTPDKLPRAYYEVPDDVILKEKPLEIRSEFVGKLPDEFQTLRVPLDERLMKFVRRKNPIYSLWKRIDGITTYAELGGKTPYGLCI